MDAMAELWRTDVKRRDHRQFACVGIKADEFVAAITRLLLVKRYEGRLALTLIPNETMSWFAVRVLPQNEQSVGAQLERKGLEQFVPTIKSVRHWSDRVKILTMPLFAGYLFCRTKRSSFGCVLNTQGVFHIVSFGGKAYPVSENEIDALRRVVESGYTISPVPYKANGRRVTVVDGPLKGVSGILDGQDEQHRLLLSIEPIMKSISIDVDSRELFGVTAKP